jgi:flagellar protein FliL
VSAKPETTDGAKPPAKSKKLLIIIIAVVLVFVLGGVGAFVFISKQRAAADGEDSEPVAAAHAVAPNTPPAYLPLDSMVVNLADPGGERVAQIGITLVVADAHASDTVKAYLPTIRSAVLLLISQRTAEELLKPEGKEKLAKDILREAAVPFGGGEDDEEDPPPTAKKKKKKAHAEYPVSAVLFSGFIVQ